MLSKFAEFILDEGFGVGPSAPRIFAARAPRSGAIAERVLRAGRPPLEDCAQNSKLPKTPFPKNLADRRLKASEVTLNSLKDTSELIGSWTRIGTQMVEDETSLLIRDLIEKRLQRIALASGGWETLYQDPQDQRFWELTFPNGEMQGGGPMALRVLSDEAARLKYDLPHKYS